MRLEVRLANPLRDVAGASAVTVELADGAARVRDALDALAADHPAVERRVRDEQGQVRRHVNVFVDADNIRDLHGLDTPLAAGTTLWLLAAVSGG